MGTSPVTPAQRHHFRFHEPHLHLASVFGDTWFGERAEAFARFFGTPTFLLGQTLVVTVWIVMNAAGLTHFDVYPFILLNLAFSLQAAYAAPLSSSPRPARLTVTRLIRTPTRSIAKRLRKRASSGKSWRPDSPRRCSSF
jgi:Protein of unknown function (DUF1003)